MVASGANVGRTLPVPHTYTTAHIVITNRAETTPEHTALTVRLVPHHSPDGRRATRDPVRQHVSMAPLDREHSNTACASSSCSRHGSTVNADETSAFDGLVQPSRLTWRRRCSCGRATPTSRRGHAAKTRALTSSLAGACWQSRTTRDSRRGQRSAMACRQRCQRCRWVFKIKRSGGSSK